MKRLLIYFIFSFFIGMNLHAQSFTLITEGKMATDSTNTNGASFIDYDADGDLDVFLTNANNPFGFNSLYRNDGKDQFTPIDAGEITGMQTPSFGHAWGDYDNDGLPDLLVVNAFTQMGSILYKNMGGGKFRRNENLDIGDHSIKGFNAAWADYDQDGFLDVVISHPARFVGKPVTSNFLFKNNGDGYFSEVASTPITRPIAPFTNASWIDYDQDGDQDLFIGSGPANGTVAPDFIYENQLKQKGKAEFTRLTSTAFAKDSLDGQVWNWVDYDNDGDLDAYVTNWGGSFGGLTNNLYRNNAGEFEKITDGDIVNDKGISLANVWADFDNDGDLDCFVGNGGNQANRFYQNNGDGSFTTITKGHFVEQKRNTWGVSVGDYDNDGDIDLFVSNKTGYVQGKGDVNFLYRNDLDNENHWLIVQLKGTESNRQGIGAKIYITANINGKSITQYREVGSSNTFLGQNDVRSYFGLGNAEKIEKMEIHWPGKGIDVIKEVALDQIMEIEEGN